MVVVVWCRYRHQRIFAFKKVEVALTALFCTVAMGVGTYCYFNLPLIDFLPYKVGANIYEMINRQHDTGSEEINEEEYVLVYRNRRTNKLREFSIDDKEWQNEEKWEWVETRVDNEVSAVHTLVSEFSITSADGDVTSQILARKGMVYLICVTDLNDISGDCRRRLRSVVEHAASYGGLVVCLTPQIMRELTYYSFDGSEPVKCYNIDATVLKTLLRAKNGLVVLEDGTITGKYNCRNIDFEP